MFDAMMVTGPASRLYATGFFSSAGVLIITTEDAWFFTDTRYFEAACAGISGARVQLITKHSTYTDQIKKVLGENGINTVGFEENDVTFAGYTEWIKKLGVKLVPAQKLIYGLRSVKTLDDLECMKKAQHIAEKSFNEVLPLINTDITEKQLAAELIYRFLLNGADDKSFDPIVVSGAKSSMPH